MSGETYEKQKEGKETIQEVHVSRERQGSTLLMEIVTNWNVQVLFKEDILRLWLLLF